jgi:hypothetical protein
MMYKFGKNLPGFGQDLRKKLKLESTHKGVLKSYYTRIICIWRHCKIASDLVLQPLKVPIVYSES